MAHERQAAEALATIDLARNGVAHALTLLNQLRPMIAAEASKRDNHEGDFLLMIIGELLSDDQKREFGSAYDLDLRTEIQQVAGYVSDDLLIEEGGRMVMIFTFWKGSQAARHFTTTKTYRRLRERTGSMLVGDFVMKTFWAR